MASPGTLGRFKGLRRLVYAPLTTDTSATTAFGAGVALGARSKMTFEPVTQTSDLKTSRGIENTDTFTECLNWTIEYGELSHAALDYMLGGKLKDDATGGKNIFAYVRDSLSGYFGLIGQPDLVEGGPADLWVALMKCKVEKWGTWDLSGDKWVMQNMSGRAFYTLKDSLLWGSALLTAKTDVTIDVVLTDLQAAVTSGS